MPLPASSQGHFRPSSELEAALLEFLVVADNYRYTSAGLTARFRAAMTHNL